jgi:carboxylesterase
MATKDFSFFLEGNRTGVLLIHGLAGTPTEMKSLALRVADTGATVYCCQLAGHCGTEQDIAATKWQDWYASVEAALCELEARCDTVVVGGLSMGALLAAMLAAKEPERVKGVLMLAPTLWYDGWAIPWYSFLLKLARFLIDTPISNYFPMGERDPYGIKDERIRMIILRAMTSGDSSAAGLLRTPPHGLRELWRLVKTLKPELRNVHQHTLLVHAREDDIAGLSNTHYLQRHLGGLVDTVILNDSYHMVTIDRQRSIVTDRVKTFVNALAASASSSKAAVPLYA